jgi:hypothetical protein
LGPDAGSGPGIGFDCLRGDKGNGGTEPGGLEEETGDSGKEPVITKGEWYFVDGEFHKFTDLSFIAYFNSSLTADL